MARFVFSLAAVSDASANALGPLAVRTALRLVDVLSAFAPSAAALERARKKRAQLKVRGGATKRFCAVGWWRSVDIFVVAACLTVCP